MVLASYPMPKTTGRVTCALKKDDDGRRWIEMEFLVPGTPEQVWQAIATGPGMSAWFTPASVDERVGGTIEFDFGDVGGSQGVITVWEPRHTSATRSTAGVATRRRWRPRWW